MSEALRRLQELLDSSQTLEASMEKRFMRPDPRFQVDTGSATDEFGNTYPLPKVTVPGQFRKYPVVSGPPRLHQGVRALLNAAPDMQGRISKISTTPTKGVISTALEQGYPVENMERSNLLGMTNTQTKDMWINPRSDFSMEETLAHEFGHAAGHPFHTPAIEELELIGKEFLDRNSPNFQPIGMPPMRAKR